MYTCFIQLLKQSGKEKRTEKRGREGEKLRVKSTMSQTGNVIKTFFGLIRNGGGFEDKNVKK